MKTTNAKNVAESMKEFIVEQNRHSLCNNKETVEEKRQMLIKSVDSAILFLREHGDKVENRENISDQMRRLAARYRSAQKRTTYKDEEWLLLLKQKWAARFLEKCFSPIENDLKQHGIAALYDKWEEVRGVTDPDMFGSKWANLDFPDRKYLYDEPTSGY